MQEIGLQLVCEEIAAAFNKQDYQRVDTLLWPALNQFPDMAQLWFYAGNHLFQTDRAAMAVQAFERCAELGENPLVLANLGAAYRKLNAHDEGIRVLKAALDRVPDYAPALVNLGSMFVNEGKPHDGIPYLERAVSLGRAGKMERGAEWNLALLYLEAGRFGEGFDLYRTGLGAERLLRSYGKESKGIPEPAVLQPDSPTEGKTLIVWGEQGIGDELMFATCIPDAQREFKEIIFECHPRLEALHRSAYPGVRLYPTRKDERIEWPVTENIHADYKCPIGDLASRYRRNLADFQNAWKGAPYQIDEREREVYRHQLTQLAEGRKIVGLATRGGVMQTSRTYRTLRVTDADFLFENTNCLFVSLDYDDMSEFAAYAMEKYPGRYVWFPSVLQHWDYHHTGALAAACDLVVTVAQSVAHLSAGLGLPTRVLCAKRCAWREVSVQGLPQEQWYWWLDPKTKLYHQSEDNKWRGPLERVIEDIKA